MNKLLNFKTVVGAGVGVAVGYFAFKSKKPLVLMAFGVGGGILSGGGGILFIIYSIILFYS